MLDLQVLQAWVQEEDERKRTGRIINISLVAGQMRKQETAGLCVSKGGNDQPDDVEYEGVPLRGDNGKLHLLLKGTFRQTSDTFPDTVKDEVIQKIPLGCMGQL